MKSRRALASFIGLLSLLLARSAHASSMDGLAVVVIGMFVAVPAAMILIAMIIGMALALGKARPGLGGARLVQFTALPLAAIYPLSFVILGDTRNMDTVIFFDIPVIALAAIAFTLACLVARKHARTR
jgi:hypothetical protein